MEINDNFCENYYSGYQEKNNPTILKSIKRVSKGTGVPKKVIEQVIDTLYSSEYIDNEEWKSVPNRVVDEGMLKAIYNEIISAIHDSNSKKRLDNSLNTIIDDWAEARSLEIYIKKLDICVPNLFLQIEGHDYESELTFDHVRVPHYETTILAFIFAATMIHLDKIESNLGKEKTYLSVINKLNRLKIEKKIRAKFFEHIRHIMNISDKSEAKITLKNTIITYNKMLTALRIAI